MRLFVAIELSEEVRAAIHEVQRSLGRECGDVRWVRADLMHLTVKFLGEVPDSQVVAVSRAVAEAAGSSSPFELSVSQCGCFPERGAVRVIWAGGQRAGAPLLAHVAAVEKAAEAIGFPPEPRPFSPHVTLGRVKGDRSRGKIRSAVEAARMREASQWVSSVSLMSSALSGGGPTYSVVSRSQFGQGPSVGSTS